MRSLRHHVARPGFRMRVATPSLCSSSRLSCTEVVRNPHQTLLGEVVAFVALERTCSMPMMQDH
eukprot:1874877-Amphidinium_carterae.1